MKKFLISLLAILTLGVSAACMTSCGGNNSNGSSEWSSESNSESNSESSVEGHTHDWNGYVSKQPNCEEDGEHTFICYCGESYSGTITKLGHDTISHSGKAATCIESGWKAYETCGRCSYTTYEEIAINKNNHNYENGVCTYCQAKHSVGLEYTLSDDGAYYIVTGLGECTDTEIVIPSIYKGLPVMSIGDDAFSDCDNLTSVEIPDSVTSIGDGAFSGCSSLTSVIIPDSVTSIGNEAFSWCESLTSVEIPDSVTSIGDGAFYWCESLTNITVDENNANYSSLDGNLYNKDQTTFIQYAIGKTDTSFIIPDSVTSIGDEAFYSCESLTSVTIGDSVTSIGNRAFSWCESLTSVIIPDSVTSIGVGAFSSCYYLTSITIPDSVTSIGGSAFSDCRSLTSVIIPDSVTSIGDEAFDYCSSLTNITVDENNANYSSLDGNLYNKDQTTLILYAIGKTDTSFTIPDSVTSIGDWVFLSCHNLTSVTIPDSVTSIGMGAFFDTGYYNDKTNWEDGVLYIGKYLIDAKDDIAGKYTIKDGTLCIASAGNRDRGIISVGNAFAFCDDLTEIVIPNSVTSIGDYAFYYCENLTSVTFEGTMEEWNVIEKGWKWDYAIPATEVVCSDGTVALN